LNSKGLYDADAALCEEDEEENEEVEGAVTSEADTHTHTQLSVTQLTVRFSNTNQITV